MSVAFDKWLTRSSTLRLLRVLTYEDGTQSSEVACRRLLSSSARSSNNGQTLTVSEYSRGRHDRPALRIRPHSSSLSPIMVDEHSRASLSLNGTTSILSPQSGDSLPGILKALNSHSSLYLDQPKVWLNILPTIQRRYGQAGILAVWEDIRLRGLDLPVTGEHAAALWSMIVTIILSNSNDEMDRRAANDPWRYTKELKERTGLYYAGLYKLLVGSLFRKSAAAAAGEWDTKFSIASMKPADALKQISDDVLVNKQFSGVDHFAILYKIGTERDLYDIYMPRIAGIATDSVALEWHRLFISHGDQPTHALLNNPSIQMLMRLDKRRLGTQHIPNASRTESKSDFDETALRGAHIPMTRADFNTIIGDVHGIKPKDISDEFCAKLFATRAFSVNFVVRSLNILGVESVGPVTIRQIALRTVTQMQFGETVRSLQKGGISTRDHPFTRLLSAVNQTGNHELWSSLLNSDVHPEAYENNETLEGILKSQLQSHSYVSAHLTLLALQNTTTESKTRGWNILLQHYITARQYRDLVDCLHTVSGNNVPLTKMTLVLLHRFILPERKAGRRYAKSTVPAEYDPLAVATQAFMYAANNGLSMDVRLWREQLKRYGMDHRWENVEQMVNWLLWKYKLSVSPMQKWGGLTLTDRRKLYQRRTFLGSFLERHTQASLLIWALRTAGVRNQLGRQEQLVVSSSDSDGSEPLATIGSACESWARGLALLKRLRDNGIWLDMTHLRKTFIIRMWVLFGPGVSCKKINNEARIANKLSLAHYIKHANEVFSGFIYWIPEEMLRDDPDSNEILLVTLFGRTRFNRKRQEYVDVEAWAKWLSLSRDDVLREPRALTHRIELWKRSRFRTTAKAVSSKTNNSIESPKLT